MGKTIKFPATEKYVKEIVTDYVALSERCDEYDVKKESKEFQNIILELKNTIRANEGMLGLSAPQIGYYKRVICLNFNGDIRTFINPVITNATGFQLSRETCHSIPDKVFIRTRNSTVDVTYQTPLGKIDSIKLVGVAAVVFQHHMDHLDGLLLSDVSLEIEEDFDMATDEEKEAIIDMYLESLDIKRKEITESIENDPEAKQMSDAIKFIDSVNKGETVIESTPMTEAEIEEFKEKLEELKKQNEEIKDDNNNKESDD